MDEQLKALLLQAQQNGASEDELRQIIRDYQSGVKKKVEASPSTSQEEMGTMGSEESTGLDRTKESSFSDLPSVSILADGSVIPEYEGDILNQYALDFDNAWEQQVIDLFNVDMYEQVLEAENRLGAEAEQLNTYRQATTEDEKYAAKKAIVTGLLDADDPDFEINRYVMGGIDEGVNKYLRGIFEYEGDYTMAPVPFETPMNEAIKNVGNKVAMSVGPEFKELLPEEIKNDPKKLTEYERYLYDEYQLSVDLNNDRYIGGYDYLYGDEGRGMMDNAKKAFLGILSASSRGLAESGNSIFGEDNAMSRYFFENEEEYDEAIKAIESKLPMNLEATSEKVDKFVNSMGVAMMGRGEVDFELADEVYDDYVRMFGESLPMMSAAMIQGLISRGRRMSKFDLGRLKGLKGAERTAALRKIVAEQAKLKRPSSTNMFGGPTGAKTTVSAAMARRAGVAQNRGAFAATTAMGMASAYQDVKDEEWFNDMGGLEKTGYIGVMGFAEGAPAAVAGGIALRNFSAIGKKGVDSWFKGFLKSTGWGMLEEGVTEGATGLLQYVTETAANPNKDFDWAEAMAMTKEAMYAGIALGGGVSVASSIPGAVYAGAMAATSLPSIRDQIEIARVAKQYDEAPTAELRKEFGAKLSDLVNRASDRKLNRRKFYEDLEQNNQEAWQQLTGIQKQIMTLSLEYGRDNNPETKKEAKAKMTALLEERTKMEQELGMEYDMDIKKEFNRISRGAKRIDSRFNKYGELFEGDSDSVSVTGENADSVLERIMSSTFDAVGHMIGMGDVKFNDGERMQKALRNVVVAAKALSKSGKFTGVVIHKTQEAFEAATGEQLARGMHLSSGEIHIFAPAVMENTGFHEAFHDLVLEAVGKDAVSGLANQLFKKVSGELRGKYLNFLTGAIERIEPGANVRNAADVEKYMKDNPLVAEEFLVEILADITNKDVDVKVRRGLLNSFGSYIESTLNSLGVGVNFKFTNPTTQDLVDAIQKMTGQMAEGEAVTATADLRDAIKAAGYDAKIVELQDMDPANKPQGIYARNRDIEEVKDAAKYADAMAKATARMAELDKKMFLQVDAMTTEEAQKILDDGGKLFMTKDGLAGAYLKADGYMGGLFKNPDSELKMVSNPLQTIRAREGGLFYDAFATKLEELYVGNGWKPVARLDFNPDFAPEGWDAENSPLKDQPDVVFFNKGEGKVGEGVRMTDYGEAYDYAQKLSQGKAQHIFLKSLEDTPGLQAFLEAEGITEEQLAEQEQALKLDENQRPKRVPKIVKALEEYVAQHITQEQYLEAVRNGMPISLFESVPEIPSTLDIGAALKSNQLDLGVIGVTKNIPEGYYVALRLDIPAYNGYDTWVVSVHQGTKPNATEKVPFLGGKSVGYGQTAVITNVSFEALPTGALGIAMGKPKTTIARMFGDWKNEDPQAVFERAEAIMKGDQYNISDLAEGKLDGWVQVGMNPFRHSWFYDKRDGNPVVSASEVIQVGALVLAKDVVKVPPTDERFIARYKANKEAEPVQVKFQTLVPGQISEDIESKFTAKAQPFGAFEASYDFEFTDNDRRRQLFKENVRYAETLESVVGNSSFISTVPDNMFVGEIQLDGQTLFRGSGGLFYPIKTENFWGFKKTPKKLVEDMNKMLKESPDGKVYMVLMTGRPQMLLTSPSGVIGRANILAAAATKLAEEGVITEAEYGRIVINAYKEVFPSSRNRKVALNKGTKAEIGRAIIAQMSDPNNELSFEMRQLFQQKMDKAFNAVFKTPKDADKNVKADAKKRLRKAKDVIGEMFGMEISNRDGIGNAITNRTVEMMTENFLIGVPQNAAYAVIEIDSPLVAETDPESVSYPGVAYMVDENGNKKPPIIHLIKNKPMFSDMEVAAKKKDGTELSLSRDAFIKLATTEGILDSSGKHRVYNEKDASQSFTARLGIGTPPHGKGKISAKAQSIDGVDVEAKAQDNLIRLVSQLIDSKYPTPRVKRDKRRKNPVLGLDESVPGFQKWNYSKAEVVATLMNMGMTKEAATALFKEAVAYKQGRAKGKKEGMRHAMANAREARKLGTKAKNLKKSLEELRDKSATFNEFLAQAIELIDERMKENSKTPFTRGQVKSLVKFIRQAHKVSPKKTKEQGLDAMQSFIDKIAKIFDQRDSKLEMQRYLDGLRHAQSLQNRLKKMARVKSRGAAAKSVATYAKVANGLAEINPALLPQNELGPFVNTLMQTISSMSKSKAVFDKEVEEYVGVAFPKTEVGLLWNKLSNYKAMEELGRQALFMARATVRAEKNGTSIQEEYDKLVKNYEMSRLSASRRAIKKFIDDNPTITDKDGNTVVLNEANPAHIELITEILAEQAADKEELKKDAIINDVLLPRIVANIDKLLEDSQIADILGFYSANDIDFDVLRERLGRLKRHQLINLDYRLDDYIVNDSVYGMGYMHALLQGTIEYPSKLRKLLDKKKVVARNKVNLDMFVNLTTWLGLALPTDNITLSKIMNHLGIAQLISDFSKADFLNTQVVELIEAEFNRIESEGGDIKSRTARAIMQVYSMARQMPKTEDGKAEAEASWYLELRDAMRRTIDGYAEDNSFDSDEIAEFEDAYNYLFGVPGETLSDMISRVESERGDIKEMVQFMADIHTTLMPRFSNYVERYLGKELELEDNYTAFEVIPETGNRSADDLIKMRVSMQEALKSSSLSSSKKVAGSSFERNPRSLKGGAKIGLDFAAANLSTIRENLILSQTIGSIVTANHMLNSDVVKEMIPSQKMRANLERKILTYIQQDTGKVPAFFKPTMRNFLGIPTKRYTNPLKVIKDATVVNLFGAIFFQTLKQSNVLLKAMGTSKNPFQAAPYLIKTTAEMAYYTLKTYGKVDSKLALDDGRYKLLQNSPVFQRDYEAGLIDPYTGSLDFDKTRLNEIAEKFRDMSLRNLKGTDKVAAVASWFSFYGDFLISEGIVESFDDINWDEQGANPNEEALAYANYLVTKDQGASTAREAIDLFQTGKDSSDAAVSYLVRNIILPFSRFALQKKGSVATDGVRMYRAYTDKDSSLFKDASKEFMLSLVELSSYAYMTNLLLPAVTQGVASMFGLRDDEEEESKGNVGREIGTQVIVDMIPVPTGNAVTNIIKEGLNRAVFYPYDRMTEGDFALGEDGFWAGYDRWNRIGKGVTVWGGAPRGNAFEKALQYTGPYGDFMLNYMDVIHNSVVPGNRVVGPDGTDYYVRPEDKTAMDIHFIGRTLLYSSALLGLSAKELEAVTKLIDDLPKNRKLSSEEALAAYEAVAVEFGQTFEGEFGEARLNRILDGQVSEFDQIKSTGKFSSAFNQIIADKHTKEYYPEEHRKYVREARDLVRKLESGRDYFVYMRGKAMDMGAEEYKNYRAFMDEFMYVAKPSMPIEDVYIEEDLIKELQ